MAARKLIYILTPNQSHCPCSNFWYSTPMHVRHLKSTGKKKREMLANDGGEKGKRGENERKRKTWQASNRHRSQAEYLHHLATHCEVCILEA